MTIQVASAAVDIMRDGHYEGAVRSLLLEGPRTNSLVRSRDLTNASWIKAGATAAANAAIAPDGTLTASALIEDAANSAHSATQLTAALTANTPQAISVYLKAQTRDWALFALIGKDGTQRGAFFNLTGSGAVGNIAGAIISSAIEALANGWYRCELTVTSSAGAAASQVIVYGANANGNAAYLGNSATALYVWDAQLEIDCPSVSSEIPTVAAAAGRSADVMYLPFPYVPQAMSVYTKFVERGVLLNATGGILPAIWYIGSAGDVSPLFALFGQAGAYVVYHHNGVGAVTVTAGPTAAFGDTVELLGTVSPTGAVTITITINGGAESVSASSAANAFAGAWSGQRLYLGSLGGVAATFGFFSLSKLAAMRGVQTMTTMRAA